MMEDLLPLHIAIVPDGNRRWAQKHGVSTFEGHQAGAQVMHTIVEDSIRRGIKYLTVWGFSADNWKRTSGEIQNIFKILELWILKDTPWFVDQGVRLRHIGRIQALPPTLQDAIVMAISLTMDNEGKILNLAFNYSGRDDIVEAARQLLYEKLPWERLDENTFSSYLRTNGMPDVDLVIRTAGEYRLSNFLLWQAAYSEFYFTNTLWPDFSVEELGKALTEYSRRKRTLGGD